MMHNNTSSSQGRMPILYPYLKWFSSNEQQQAWFLRFYHKKIAPYIRSITDTQVFEAHKITELDQKLDLLRKYFDYDRVDSGVLKEELFPLDKALNTPEPLVRIFENDFFRNITHQKPGFNIDQFYPENHTFMIQKMLKVAVLLYMHELAIQAVSKAPSHSKAQRQAHLVWTKGQIKAWESFCENEQPQGKAGYQPNLWWYGLIGANRFPLLLQTEIFHLKQMWGKVETGMQVFDKPDELSHKVNELVFLSLQFLGHLLFLTLMPYRVLKTAVNELYHYTLTPLDYLLYKAFPKQMQQFQTQMGYTLLKGGIYLALLSLMSMPWLPVPISWIPRMFSSPMIGIIPLSYCLSMPLLGLCQKLFFGQAPERADQALEAVVKKEGEKHPDLHSEPTDRVALPTKKNSILFQYPRLSSSVSQKREVFREESLLNKHHKRSIKASC